MATMTDKSTPNLRFLKSDAFFQILEKDSEILGAIHEIDALADSVDFGPAVADGAAKRLMETYQKVAERFKITIERMESLWSGDRLKRLRACLWMAINTQVATGKIRTRITEKNAKGVMERVTIRANYLAFLAAQFQTEMLRQVPVDVPDLKAESLAMKTLENSLKLGKRRLADKIVREYNAYLDQSLRLFQDLKTNRLLYREDGNQDLRKMYAFSEICLVLYSELHVKANYFNGNSLKRLLGKLDPDRVESWFTQIPDYGDSLEKLNDSFRTLSNSQYFKVLRHVSLELEDNYRKLADWTHGLLLDHRLDLIDAYWQAKLRVEKESPRLNAVCNIYETGIKNYWMAKKKVEDMGRVAEPNLLNLLLLKNQIHSINFVMEVAVFLLRKITIVEKKRQLLEVSQRDARRLSATLNNTPVRPGHVTPKGPGQATPKGPRQATAKRPGQTTPKRPGQTTPKRPGQTTPKRLGKPTTRPIA